MKKINLINIFVTIVIVLIIIFSTIFIIREVKAKRTPVEITVEITGTFYKEPYSTVQYNPSTKTNIIINHDAEYKTYFKYETFTIISNSSYVYDYCYSRKGDKIKIKATKVEYTDSDVRYVFNKILY